MVKKSKIISKQIIKKELRATYDINADAPRSSSFQKAWNKESMLKWG